MGIKSIDEVGLSDSEIENYQFVEKNESQNSVELSEPSGQYNFSGFILSWQLNLS